MRNYILIAALLFFSSCKLGPNYERPENIAQQIEKFKNFPIEETEDKDLTEQTSLWWKRLDDPTSEMLVEKLLVQNFDIEAANARLKQAIERAKVAGADLYPTLSGDFTATRIENPPISQGFGTGKPINNFDLGLSSSWQLDFFGRTSSNLDGRRAEIEGSIFEIDALIHSLIAQVISQRVAVALDARRLDLVEQTILSNEKTLGIIERRYRSGVGTVKSIDVRLARENLAATKAEFPIAQANLAESIYELDLLLGQQPGDSGKMDYKSFPVLPPPEKIEIFPPAELLDRRPDLRASELRLIAANEDIGIAMADLFPNLAISGSYGTTSNEISNILDANQMAWSLVGSLTQKIFEGGRLRANIRLNEARAEELSALYKKDILTAVKEVEIGLLKEEKLHSQVELLAENLKQTEAAEKLSNTRYIQGIGSILELLDTQRRLWRVEQNLLNAQEANWQNRIALYLALGGDWQFKGKIGDDNGE